MDVLVVGISHKSAPLEVLEKVALGKKQAGEALIELSRTVPGGGVVLSTCNRTEIYALSDGQDSQAGRLEGFLRDRSGLSASDLSPHLYSRLAEDAISHLFNVASGLESMIVGEFEVLGQVQDALEYAQDSGVVDRTLLDLLQQAVRVGRRARAETDISKNPVSISSVAVNLAKRTVGDLTGCSVLLVSAGEASRLAATALARHGISDIVVASRSYDKAFVLAREFNGRAAHLHDLRDPLRKADIVVSCSGAPHCLVHGADVEAAMSHRPLRPMVLVDIAVPRDIDPRVSEIENVHLYNIDDLKSVSAANQRRRAKERDRVLSIVDDEVAGFISRSRSQRAAPTIAALVGKAEKIRASQVAAAMATLDISDEERAAVNAMTRSIVKKILHDPIARLRSAGNGNSYVQAVEEMFDLDNPR